MPLRLLGGLTTVSMSELLLCPDLVTLASGGAPMPGMDIGVMLTPFQVLCMISCLGVFFASSTLPDLQWT
jgi:hypothetical protein